MAAQLLLLEDDPAIARTVIYTLERDGLGVTHSLLLRDARQQMQARAFDLLVLDVGLPDGSGLDLLQQVRNTPAAPGTPGTPRATPVLMLSARGEELDRVLGLELGADDYLTKPFSMAELLARVKALLRRAQLILAAQAASQTQASTLRNGVLEVWPTKREVRMGGVLLEFTALEFDLLLHFVQHPGQVFSRGQLLSAVWGYSHDGYEHTVTTHINRLRAKLEHDPMHPQMVLTVRGAGYKMREAPR